VVTCGGGIDFKYKAGMMARDMFRATRAALYETAFETFERRIRTHLARVLADGGFDPANDIKGITISRWGHGYAMGQNLLFDPDWSEEEYPWVVGRSASAGSQSPTPTPRACASRRPRSTRRTALSTS
jgi:spermidine dehydrogenase